MDGSGPWLDGAGASDAGPRPDNQDRWAVGVGWGVVCDGVGGHRGGGRAAQLALEAAVVGLADDPRDAADAHDRMTTAVLAGDVAVRHGQDADPAVAHMATTLTMARCTAASPAGSRWAVAHVGDSPAWSVTVDDARQLTDDHSLAGELLASGALTAAEARRHPGRRLVTRALGVGHQPVTPDVAVVSLAPGDALVLATDGLSDVLDAAAIGSIVRNAATSATATSDLVHAALDAGTTDNVTVVVLRHRASCADGPTR